MEQRTCRVCGQPFMPRNRFGRPPVYCGECRPKTAAIANEQRPSGGRRRCACCGLPYDATGINQRFCRVECGLLGRSYEQHRKSHRPAHARPRCVICSGPVIARLPQATVCSQKCSVRRAWLARRVKPEYRDKKAEANRRYRANRPPAPWNDTKKAAYHRRRARKKMGAAGERIVPRQVFDRDGWQCGICRRKVNPDLVYPHKRSASLDHIIPLSKGGAHVMTNVQCAHLDCNMKKRDHVGGAGDQLRLIG